MSNGRSKIRFRVSSKCSCYTMYIKKTRRRIDIKLDKYLISLSYEQIEQYAEQGFWLVYGVDY